MRIALAWLDLDDPTDKAVALGLGRALRARGHAVAFVGPKRKPGPAAIDGFPVRRVSTVSQLKAIEADVWHCHVFARDHALFLKAKLSPMIVTPHLILEDYLPFIGGKRGLQKLAGRARFVTAVSEASRRELRSLLPGLRCEVVYNGAAAAPRGRDGRSALCPARLAPYKGQDLLLMALAKVPGARVLLAGRDQQKGGLRKLAAALRLGSRARFLGPVPPGRLRKLMADCRFVVLPSRRENCPLALLEAVALGKAVIAARVGGIPELIRHGKNGLLVEPNDVAGLAEAIRRLDSDKSLRRRLGAKPSAFSWERAAAAYEKLYSSCSPSKRK